MRVSIVFSTSPGEAGYVIDQVTRKIWAQIDRPPALCDHPEAADQLRDSCGTVVGRVVVSPDDTPEQLSLCLVEALRDAIVDVDGAWPLVTSDSNPLCRGYPFDEDFNDLVEGVCKWAAAQKVGAK